jgi:exopolysaccharide biosynthesis polyprenyl glycosylphosphotransferase
MSDSTAIIPNPSISPLPQEDTRLASSRIPVLIVGAGWAGVTIAEELLKSGAYELLGFLDDRLGEIQTVEVGGVMFPVLDTAREIRNTALRLKAKEVVTAITHVRSDHILSGVVACFESGIKVHRMPDIYSELTGKVPLKHIDEHWVAPHLKYPRMDMDLWMTQIMDYGITLILFIFLFLPMFPFVALAIKLTSPGPLLFLQKRVGFGGRRFTILKFRTMTHKARNQGASWTTENDVRITRIGNFLRKYRIDELPQLINVLRGEMSLVGPRPEAVDLVAMYRKEIPFYEYRYFVKPGITGWAQVEYRNTCSVEGALEKLQYDLFWIKNRSLLLHSKTILKTIKVTLTGFGSV